MKTNKAIECRLDKIVGTFLCYFSFHDTTGKKEADCLNEHTKCRRCDKKLIRSFHKGKWTEIDKFTGWQSDGDRHDV